MDKQPGRNRPAHSISGKTQEGVMKHGLVLVASAEIALQSLDYLEGTGASFYRHEVKRDLKRAQNTLIPYLDHYLNWEEADDPNQEAEMAYMMVARMIEKMCKIIQETPGQRFQELDAVLDAFTNGEYTTVDSKEFERISQKEGKADNLLTDNVSGGDSDK